MHHAPPAGRLPWSAHILTTRVAIGSSTVQRHFCLQGNVYNDPVSAKLLFPQHTSFAVRAIPRPWIPGLVSQCCTRLAAVPFFSDAVEKKKRSQYWLLLRQNLCQVACCAQDGKRKRVKETSSATCLAMATPFEHTIVFYNIRSSPQVTF